MWTLFLDFQSLFSEVQAAHLCFCEWWNFNKTYFNSALTQECQHPDE